MKNLDVGDLKRTLPSVDSWLAILAMEKSGDLINAAKSLGVTQPALSFHLKKLEEQMGFALFSFSGKRKVLTKIGQAYVEELKAGLLTLHDAQDKVLKAASDMSHQKLRVAGRRELLIPLLPFPFPGKMELLQTTSADAMQALRDHQVDLAISVRPLDSNDLLAKLFFESGFKVIAPKTWRLKNLEWESLKEHPVVAYGNHQAYLEEYLKWKEAKIRDLTVSRVVEDWFSVVELVRHGLGWAVIPEAWGIHTDQVEVRHLQAHELEKQKVFLFYRKEDRKSAWIRALSEWLKEANT